MAPLQALSHRKVLPFYLLLFSVFTFVLLVLGANTETDAQNQRSELFCSRRILQLQKEDQPIKNKTTLATKNQTQLYKPITSSTKNQTKKKANLIKPTTKTLFNKLNSTLKASNSTKSSSLLTKNSSDLVKRSTPKNKTTKATTKTETENQSEKKLSEEKTKSKDKNQSKDTITKPQKSQKTRQPNLIDEEEEDGLVSEFRNLPSKFQETLLPDLERISTTSKVYLTKANKEITKGVKPIVGKKYAPTIAPIVSFAFILIPLIVVSLIFNCIKAYFSLQRLLIFIQVYLSIYFSILSLSSLVTGLEPLRFFYATSQSAYICLQVLQALGFFLYLLLLLMYLVLLFSTETGLASKLLGLGQNFVAFSVGLHYYMTVFHRAVLHQPPKTSWEVHAVYSTAFFVICLLGNVDRRKKAYLEDGGEEGKKN